MQRTLVSLRASLWTSVGLVALVACGGAVASSDHLPGADDPAQQGSGSGSRPSSPPSETTPEPTTPCEGPSAVETVADLRNDPNLATGRIVVDERYLYVDTSRGAYRVRKCGGGAIRISENAPGQYTASGLVQDQNSIYLAAMSPVQGGFVRRIAKDGSRTEELVTTSRDLFGLALVNDGVGRLVWVERAAQGDELREMLLTTRATKLMANVPAAYSYGPFCSDPGGVSFFALTGSNSGRYYTFTPSRGLSWSASGPTANDMAVGPPQFDGEASDLLFSFGHTGRNGVGRVLRAGSSSSSTIDLVAGASAPFGLSRRSTGLYFADASKGVVQRCTFAPTSPTPSCEEISTIASGEDDPRFVTTDATAVYWATRRGLLRRAPL